MGFRIMDDPVGGESLKTLWLVTSWPVRFETVKRVEDPVVGDETRCNVRGWRQNHGQCTKVVTESWAMHKGVDRTMGNV
jgi:hypothetical protein